MNNCLTCRPAFKRLLICLSLGLAFGIFCAWSARGGNPEFAKIENYWLSAMAWVMIFNRMLIGFVVFLAGAFKRHPIFGFRCFPFLRGTMMGVLVSLVNAIGILTVPGEQMWFGFWATITAGAIYGAIIDLVATKFAGEGAVLLWKEKES